MKEIISYLLLIAIIFFIVVLFTSECRADVDLVDTGKKFIFTDWLKQETLKWGTVSSICGYQALNGLTEGYHFRQENTYLINGGNYHAFVTGQRLAGITTGWFMYANIRNKNQSWFGKFRRFLGSSLIARNAFEWSYKGARYGNPFDYTEKHNEHSIVYFGFRDGKLTDLYIGTGSVTGPLVDLGCLLFGWIILE